MVSVSKHWNNSGLSLDFHRHWIKRGLSLWSIFGLGLMLDLDSHWINVGLPLDWTSKFNPTNHRTRAPPFLTSSTLDFETTSGIHQWGQGSIPVSPSISYHIRALVIRYRWGKGPILASETCAESLWGTMMYFQQMWAITCWLRSEWATLTQHMRWPCLHPKKCSAPSHSRGRFPSRTSWRC